MVTRRYGISGSDMFKRYNENACITNYIRVKSEIVQKINELQKKEPSHFCNNCGVIRTHIFAENNKINNCFFSNSKSPKLIDDDDIKRFIQDCIEYKKCVHNRTSSAKKTAAPARASAGKDKQQSGRDSKTSKPGDSPIKGPSGQDQNRANGKALTEAKPIAQKSNGISSPHNSGEAQEDASKQIANPPISTSGRIETQEQRISPSAHRPVSGTGTHPSGSIEGTPKGKDQLLKSTKFVDSGKGTSQSDSTSDQVAKEQNVKNQDSGDGASVTEITKIRDPATKGVDTDACSNTPEGKETCDEKSVIRESAIVSSVDVSTKLDITLDEYECSEEDFYELLDSETLRGEAGDREVSSIKVTGNEKHGTVLNASEPDLNAGENTEHAVLSQGHFGALSEGASGVKTCQSTAPIISIPRCVHSNSVTKFEKNPQKETRSEQENNQGQLSSRQESHQVHQLSQQKLAQKQGRLHSQQESSIQEEAHSGGNHYIIKDIIQHLHLQKNCSFNQIIYYPRSERSIYTNKFIYI
ncbi:VIR protein [Plasmodium vivax]|uniref:VIR protein n=1 Tax=Plasmodium vivax TaxID=5855 RepID=A0A1G4E461_PLAVI|nr:VIR protein [Plasmodium vivax]